MHDPSRIFPGIRDRNFANCFVWAHAGRGCPVLTKGGVMGLTEGPNTWTCVSHS